MTRFKHSQSAKQTIENSPAIYRWGDERFPEFSP